MTFFSLNLVLLLFVGISSASTAASKDKTDLTPPISCRNTFNGDKSKPEATAKAVETIEETTPIFASDMAQAEPQSSSPSLEVIIESLLQNLDENYRSYVDDVMRELSTTQLAEVLPSRVRFERGMGRESGLSNETLLQRIARKALFPQDLNGSIQIIIRKFIRDGKMSQIIDILLGDQGFLDILSAEEYHNRHILRMISDLRRWKEYNRFPEAPQPVGLLTAVATLFILPAIRQIRHTQEAKKAEADRDLIQVNLLEKDFYHW